jgi:multisubunit Na+/H+ antiporter MnhB subunit
VKRSLILDTVVRTEFHTLLLVSVYLLFAGHNHPGGGFAGGLVAGAAFALRYVAGGVDEVRRAIRVRPPTLLGFGLLLATVTEAVPLLLGRSVAEHDSLSAELPLLGTVKTTTVVFFDTGVFLVVLGMVLMVLEVLGDDGDTDRDARTDTTTTDTGAGTGTGTGGSAS